MKLRLVSSRRALTSVVLVALLGVACARDEETLSSIKSSADARIRGPRSAPARDETAEQLTLNDIGRIKLRTTIPLLADEYRRNRTTGGFILIDETTNRTVAAGMIIEAQ